MKSRDGLWHCFTNIRGNIHRKLGQYISGWKFHPLWKILVSWAYYSQYGKKMFQTTNQYIYWYGMILWDKNDNFSGNILAHIFLLQSCNHTLAMRNRRAEWIVGGYPLDDIGIIWLAVSHMRTMVLVYYGIFIYKTGWFLGQMLVNIPAPGFACGYAGDNDSDPGMKNWMMDEEEEEEEDDDDDDDDVISWARYPPRIDASWLSFQSVGQSSRHEPHFHARSGGLCPNVGA